MALGKRDSFGDLYSAYSHTVFTTALAILKNPDTALDVVHDVFLRAWQQAGQYDPSRGTPGVWLRAVARNLSIDRLRSAQRVLARAGNLDEACTPADESLSQLLTREQLNSVRRAFHMLPPMHRQLIEMAYDQEMSHTDIAKQLRQPLGTIKSRIRQAHAMLRALAGQLESDADADTTSWLEPASEAFTTVEADAGEPRAPLRDLNVLVVDDDEETARLVSAVLRKFGLRPEARTSAKDGLAALRESWPDVMISDLNMPEEDGYSLIGKARAMAAAEGRCLRAAAFTSWASEQERSRALVAGFDLYINKPVHPLALVAAVATLSGESV